MQQGTNIASVKTPNKGPEVAEENVMDVSIIPDNNSTTKLIPITNNPQMTLIVFIAYICCISVLGAILFLMKSSKITVDNEFKLDAFKLK